MKYLAKDIYENPPLMKADSPFKLGDELACMYGKSPLFFPAKVIIRPFFGDVAMQIQIGDFVVPNDFFENAVFSDEITLVNIAYERFGQTI